MTLLTVTTTEQIIAALVAGATYAIGWRMGRRVGKDELELEKSKRAAVTQRLDILEAKVKLLIDIKA